MKFSYPLILITATISLATSSWHQAEQAQHLKEDFDQERLQHAQKKHEVFINPNVKIATGQGILVGELTDHSAVLQIRLTTSDQLIDKDLPGTEGVILFSIDEKTDKTLKRISSPIAVAKKDHDCIARIVVKNLKPDQDYICTTKIIRGNGKFLQGPSAVFKTLPGAEKETSVKFVVVTGMNYAKFHGDDRIDQAQHLLENNTKLPKPYQGKDKHLGYPALKSILALNPNFFIGTGDNVYYDTPDNPRAKTIVELRQKWHEQFAQPRFHDLFEEVPTYWMIDDHDYRIDDGDNTGDHDPSPELGRQMMLEQLPLAAHEEKNVKTYRTHRINKNLQIWFVENRMYRSPNAMKDGFGKSIWGAKQKAWLKKTLLESDATFKLLLSPTPMIGPDDARKIDNHTNPGGFRHERDGFFTWLKETGVDQKNFYLVCGDRHWQYHAKHPSGIEEFSCGALIDANSRLGRKPGDPKSTDPNGFIKQLYSQKKRSGGFLEIKVTPALKNQPSKLNFVFHDEQGNVLYTHTKTGK